MDPFVTNKNVPQRKILMRKPVKEKSVPLTAYKLSVKSTYGVYGLIIESSRTRIRWLRHTHKVFTRCVDKDT